MYFRQFLNERCGCASYLIASRETRRAVVVDPALEIEQYEAVARERGFRLAYVIDTHVHADHVSGARLLATATGAELCLFEGANVAYPFRPLADGEILWLGAIRLEMLHTPGHRPEMTSILVADTRRGESPALVLTGDSLLVGDVGRPDFGGGDPAAQYDSVTRLLRLPDWVAVFPGHFEGPCAVGMSGWSSSTVGIERRCNPMANLGADDFVARLEAAAPPRPLNMNAIEPTNRGELDLSWAMPRGGDPVPEISVDAVDELVSERLAIVDVREPAEFANGHIPRSINIPQCDLALRLSEIASETPTLVVCRAGARSYKAAQFLAERGFPLVASLRGGVEAWAAAGRSVAMDGYSGAVDERRIAAIA